MYIIALKTKKKYTWLQCWLLSLKGLYSLKWFEGCISYLNHSVVAMLLSTAMQLQIWSWNQELSWKDQDKPISMNFWKHRTVGVGAYLHVKEEWMKPDEPSQLLWTFCLVWLQIAVQTEYGINFKAWFLFVIQQFIITDIKSNTHAWLQRKQTSCDHANRIAISEEWLYFRFNPNIYILYRYVGLHCTT